MMTISIMQCTRLIVSCSRVQVIDGHFRSRTDTNVEIWLGKIQEDTSIHIN